MTPCPPPATDPAEWWPGSRCAMADGPEADAGYSLDERVWFDRVRPEGGLRSVDLPCDCEADSNRARVVGAG